MLTARGFREVMNNSLTAFAYYENNKDFPATKTVVLKNPLSSELNAMRQTLLFGMLESAVININRQKHDVRFYEFGNVYKLKENKDKNKQSSYEETYNLGILTTGTHKENFWDTKPEENGYFLLKQNVELILKRLGIIVTKKQNISNDTVDFGIKYFSGEQQVFFIGKVNSEIIKKFDLEQNVFFAETNFGTLIKLSVKNKIEFEELPKFPEVQRDFAIVINKNTTYEEIEEIIKSVKNRLLKEIFLFDIYENEEKLGKGKKSYAIRLVLQDKMKTLKDEEANKLMFKIINKLEKELGAEVRS
jgi:phenylalanyl-tRNA synthetase beta chain